MKHIIEFENPAATSLEISGGKGANLALLTQRGFAVPRGFVVAVTGYREFIRQTEEAIGNRWSDPGGAELREMCAALQSRLRRLPVPADLGSAIARKIATFPEGTPLP